MKLPLSGHSFLVRFVVLGTFALFFGRGVGVVSADIVQTVRFAQGARVIVWEGSSAPITAQSVTINATSLQQVTAPLAGKLIPIQASAEINLAGTAHKTFRIASNAPFAIRAQASVSADYADMPINLTMTAIGPNAQDPDGKATNASNLTFGDLTSPRVIYQATKRTALRRGSASSQAVEFTASWPQTEAVTVTFTVFTP